MHVCRGRFCAGRGTLCSGTMGPSGTWRTQLDINSLPQPSVSWSPLPTLKQWPSLTSECVLLSHTNIYVYRNIWFSEIIGWQNVLFQCSSNSVSCCVLAAWPASKKLLSRRWQAASQLWWNVLMSWRRPVVLAQVHIQFCFVAVFMKAACFICCANLTVLFIFYFILLNLICRSSILSDTLCKPVAI